MELSEKPTAGKEVWDERLLHESAGGPMNLLVVGLSYRYAPAEVLERVAASCADGGKVLDQLLDRAHIAEALLLCTCNRIEVYAVVTAFHDALAETLDVLARQCAMTPGELSKHLYVHYGDAGVEHLFLVAAGLDSMVLGEAQILGQLRAAYAGGEQAGTVGRALHDVAQRALRVGKRIHAETAIDAAGASVLSEALAAAAVALAGPDPDALAGRRVMVLGAGSMGSLAAAHLRRTGVAELVLANRTAEKAHRLAALCEADGTSARVISLDGVAATMPTVDLVICCTAAAAGVVISIEDIGVRRRPLVVCDLGLPRNVEPAVGDLLGVTLLDLTTVAQRQEHPGTPGAVEAAQHLVAQEVQSYLLAQRTAEVIPTVTALRTWAADMVDTELLRLDRRLPGLDSAVRAELTRTVRRVVDKLLHAPTVRVQELAKADGGEAYANALRELFELNPEAPTAISTPRRRMSRSTRPGRTGVFAPKSAAPRLSKSGSAPAAGPASLP
ncbi:MAG TPA: glutamyl-tRNA reductase [Mycobacterium sp.]|nr:glutamyl-tRNA reductase [Mycobacterium sp.]